MSKPRRDRFIGPCAYCGEIKELESDHVVPKSLFINVNQAKVTVPACVDCNRKKSRGEDDLRDYMVLTKRIVNHPVADQLVDRIAKATRKGLSQIGRAAIGARLAPYINQQGIYLGAEFTADLSHVKYLTDALCYLVRGLYFHERGERLPEGTDVSVLIIPSEQFVPTLRKLKHLPHPPPRILGDHVFGWVPLIPEDAPGRTAWILCFYGGALAIGLTGVSRPPEPARKKPWLTSKNRNRRDRLRTMGYQFPTSNDVLEIIAEATQNSSWNQS